MTISQLRRRIDALKRRFAPELAISSDKIANFLRPTL